MSNTGRGASDKSKKDESDKDLSFQITPIPIAGVATNNRQTGNLILGIFNPITNPEPFPVNQLIDGGRLRDLDNKPVLYKAGALPHLLKLAAHRETKKNSEIAIRFLVTTNNHLIFAQEGSPSGDIPAHFQMADADIANAKCLTAGNAYFNKKGELCRINHKSGDFRPSFDSLQFLMPLIAQLGIPLADELKIDKLDKRGAHIATVSVLSIDIQRLEPAVVAAPTTNTELNHPTSTTTVFSKLNISVNDLHSSRLTSSSGSFERDNDKSNINSNNVNKYLSVINALVQLLPNRSSTKEVYQKILDKESGERVMAELKSTAMQTIKRHTPKNKRYSEESNKIHAAISQLNPREKLENSSIYHLYLERVANDVTQSTSKNSVDDGAAKSVRNKSR